MAKVELEGNADAVEFCPNKPYLNILAAASYTLQEASENQGEAVRLGGLYLFSAELQTDDYPPSTLGLKRLYHHELPGIFDIKWRPSHDGPPVLAAASADGSLRLYNLKEGLEPALMQLAQTANVDIGNSMCLYVDWNPTYSNPQAALSHSNGSISVVDLGNAEPEISATWKAHDFEAWVVSYDSWNHHLVYSGGDDCQFNGWDLRQRASRPTFRDMKTHQMGVCSIQGNPLWENMVVTGSYDENIRLWDLRMIQRPLVKGELGLGGGVWRLKWHHADRELVLAACMHNGAAIACVSEDGVQILEQYKDHKSLTYGASWFRGDREDVSGCLRHSSSKGLQGLAGATRDGSADGASSSHGDAEHIAGKDNSGGVFTLASTCSFYDKELHLWQPKTSACRTRVKCTMTCIDPNFS